MSAYTPLYYETFEDCIKSHKKAQNVIDRVETIAQRIIENPLNPPSYPLRKKGNIDLRGKRCRHFASHYCVVYMVCEECITQDYKGKGYNACYFCDSIPKNTVIFLAFDHHDDIYAREWGIPQYQPS